jgi:nicotinate-nucleotide pyrophosphorylase (carboxylating)
VRPALEKARVAIGHLVKIEIEVDGIAQLKEVIASGKADAVLLDNMDTKTLAKAVALVNGKLTTEASGGVTLETVAEIAATGVDLISSGALTHSAPALDVALDVQL